MINELFDQYDSNIGMSVKADDEKTENQKKAEEILNKIKYIQTELENSTEMNIILKNSKITMRKKIKMII